MLSQSLHIGRVLAVAVLLAISLDTAYAAVIARVRGFVLNSSLELGQGTVYIEWNRFVDSNGVSTPVGFKRVDIKDGVFDVTLKPNQDSKPTGSIYRATYRLESGESYVEHWVVPPDRRVVSVDRIRVVEEAPDLDSLAPRMRNMWRPLGWN